VAVAVELTVSQELVLEVITKLSVLLGCPPDRINVTTTKATKVAKAVAATVHILPPVTVPQST
jgi:hypothetical protein